MLDIAPLEGDDFQSLCSLAGTYFNDQERQVSTVQWVEALSLSRDRWRGQHLFKVGFDRATD